MTRTLFITGTDTAAGKTVLSALLARYLRGKRIKVAALKPICSGGRDDARVLGAALDGSLTLAEVNPWHFRAPIAPVLAARLENKSVSFADVLAFIRAMQKKFEITLVEGAGGLLSPLGEDFDSRGLIAALRAAPIVVAQNRLGVVNHMRLTLEALPKNARAAAKIVLMSPPRADAATASNAKLLAQFYPAEKILSLPWLGVNFDAATALKEVRVRKAMAELAKI